MGKVLIIAEAGVNHNGELSIAKQLVDVAKDSGADIVKFQTYDVNAVSSKVAEMATYQQNNTGRVTSQKEMLSELALSQEDFRELSDYCRKKEMEFLSTPFDIPSIKFLQTLGCNRWKIPSGEINNYPYLVEIAKTNEDIILSTGMSTIDEVESAVKLLQLNGTAKISLLHCTTQYPTSYEDVNLKAMLTLKEKLGVEVGYSDHTKGIEIAIAAVAMGATVIEKHFTLDRSMQGPDHKASLEPDELKEMVSSIRHVESAFGTGEKRPVESELENIRIARKSIVAKCVIRAGDILTGENITTKRPGNGINPMQWTNVVGTRAIRDFAEDELIEI